MIQLEKSLSTREETNHLIRTKRRRKEGGKCKYFL